MTDFWNGLITLAELIAIGFTAITAVRWRAERDEARAEAAHWRAVRRLDLDLGGLAQLTADAEAFAGELEAGELEADE